MPGSSEMPGTSGIDTTCDSSAIVASITVARRVDTDHDNKPRSSGTRPASIPGTMSPPAGSQSTTRTGEGHTMASAHVEVVVPGAALPDVITVNIADHPPAGSKTSARLPVEANCASGTPSAVATRTSTTVICVVASRLPTSVIVASIPVGVVETPPGGDEAVPSVGVPLGTLDVAAVP